MVDRLNERAHDRALIEPPDEARKVAGGAGSTPPEGGRARSSKPPAPGTGISPIVLVVDDDEDTRGSIRDLLAEEGFAVEEATNGQEALARLQRGPRPTLVLLDLMMPVMDGQTLLSHLAALPTFATLPIVVTTASDIGESTSTLRVPLLRKPFARDSLLQIVEQYAPRFWDDDEPPTEDRPLLLPDATPVAAGDTMREVCVVCGVVGQSRCVGCGEPYCRSCLDAGPDGLCTPCWRRAHQAPP